MKFEYDSAGGLRRPPPPPADLRSASLPSRDGSMDPSLAAPRVAVAVQRMPITMASAVTIVMLGKLLGAALRGPVGAIFGGFMALVFTSASVPVTRRFVWIVRRGGRQGVIGPFFFTDERAIQQHRALENEGCRLVRLVHLDDQWLIDQRSGTIG